MFIPLIPKNPELSDLNCRDGEIDFILFTARGSSDRGPEETAAEAMRGLKLSLTASNDQTSAIHTVRIPLQSGDRQKAELMLSGDISRVDPATAERLTQAMVEKAAETLLDLSTDLRRQGLFILPFRFYTMIRLPDGTLSYPTPQGVALPTDRPPHPEITAAGVTDDCMTLALRFPVSPHRLTLPHPSGLPEGCMVHTFISYPLYIPDPKEMRGSIGSVKSAAGGQGVGIRFGFLSSSALKASVAAPEKYYEMVGNGRTGYRISSKAASLPDYSCYAASFGGVAPFPRQSLILTGDGVDPDTDPLDWIADWVKTEEGYLPASLPYKYWSINGDNTSGSAEAVWPEGIDPDTAMATAERLGLPCILLTRPMAFASDSVGRRHAEPTAICSMRVVGLPSDKGAHTILYGSDDGVRWTAHRQFDPRSEARLLTPPRLFWRLLLMEGGQLDRYPYIVTSVAPKPYS